MRASRLTGVVAAGALSFVFGVSNDARACSGFACVTGGFVPREHGTVPSNVPAFLWKPSRPLDSPFATGDVDGGPAELYLSDGFGRHVPLTSERVGEGKVLLTPATPLVPGQSYLFSGPDACGGTLPATFTFTAGNPAPLPTTLERATDVDTSQDVLELAGGAGCSEHIDSAQAHVSLELSESATPWKDAFVYTTWVDGNRWDARSDLQVFTPYGESWVGRGRDLVYAACETTGEADPGVGEGTHSVEFHAELPGAGIELHSTPVMVTLQCREPADAGSATSTASYSAGGCECQIGIRRRQSRGWGLLVALSLAVVARRSLTLRSSGP